MSLGSNYNFPPSKVFYGAPEMGFRDAIEYNNLKDKQ
jgi:hypothetical protein